jgi:hypothetical protein
MKKLIEAIVHKYGNVFSAEFREGSWVITSWSHPTLPKPAQSDYASIVNDYRSDMNSRKAQRRTRKRALMQKLGISREDIKGLVEIIKDENDD